MATINITFDPGKETAEQLGRTQPENYDAGVLNETFFFMPVRLTIDGVEILDLRKARPGYLELPLLGFCASLDHALTKIRPGVQVDGYLAGGGELRFLEEGDRIKVWCTLNDRVAYVTRRDLIDATRKFRDEVRDWTLKNVPALQTHEYWTKWFPGPSAYPQ